MDKLESLVTAYFKSKTAEDSAFLSYIPTIKAEIALQQLHRAQRYFFSLFVLFLGSVGIFIWGGLLFISEAVNTGVGQLLSIAWSDFGSISEHWFDYLISIGESLPVTAIMICLVAAFVCALSIRAFISVYEVYYKDNKVYGKN